MIQLLRISYQISKLKIVCFIRSELQNCSPKILPYELPNRPVPSFINLTSFQLFGTSVSFLLFHKSQLQLAIKAMPENQLKGPKGQFTTVMFSTTMGLSTLVSNAEPNSVKVYWLIKNSIALTSKIFRVYSVAAVHVTKIQQL